jgi:predicted Zn-dependent protease
VLPPIAIPEATILDGERQQYAAHVMLKEIERQMPFGSRRHSHLLGVTDHDIYGTDTSFVFSWQHVNENHAVGVLSTSRFVSGIPEFYEPDIIPTRRVALQALSTTGQMLGFERPTDPQCPLAYPNSVEEFQQKRLRLCASEEQQRDELLHRKGGATAVFGAALAEKIDDVYRRYFIQ